MLGREQSSRSAGATPTLGIAIVDLQFDQHVSLHGSAPFPPEDIANLAIAFVAYRFADQNRLRLDDRTLVTNADVRAAGAPSPRFIPGVGYPYWQLLRALIVDDDRTARAAVLRRTGGIGSVQAVLDRLGLKTLRVENRATPKRSTPPNAGATADAVAALLAGIAENRLLLLDATSEYLDALNRRTGMQPATIVSLPDGRRIVCVTLFVPSVDVATRTTVRSAVARAIDAAFE